jgi:hypothetical protein
MQLAGMFTCPVELLESTISKCLKYQKIEDRGNGIYYVCNWEEYALSKRRKQQIAQKGEAVAQNVTSLYSILLSSSDLSSSSLSWVGITEADKSAWAKAYPACDIERELLAMLEWIKSHPKEGKKSRYRVFITGWLKRQQDRGGSNRGGRFSGQSKDIYSGLRAFGEKQGVKTDEP